MTIASKLTVLERSVDPSDFDQLITLLKGAAKVHGLSFCEVLAAHTTLASASRGDRYMESLDDICAGLEALRKELYDIAYSL